MERAAAPNTYPMLVTASCARSVLGVPFPPHLLHPPWCYLFDATRNEWVFVGAPHSPTGVMDVSW